jgi:hypothetical protein
MNWIVGITTIPARRETYLPDTLESIERAGFPKPRLFVDGSDEAERWVPFFGAERLTLRWPNVGAFGNFALGLWELVMRNPTGERFIMFQDDVVCCKNLREYLDKQIYPTKGYWNLFTYGRSERAIQALGGRKGWVEGGMILRGEEEDGWVPQNKEQKGQGCLAVVFDREAAVTLLEQPPFIRKPISASRPKTCVDGAIVGAMNHAGYREWVHGPSLVQHIGIDSSIQKGKQWKTFSDSFRGEEWDPNL